MNHKNVNEREPFGFVSLMFGFTQPGCYASIVNITNLKNDLICQNTTPF